MEELLQTKPSEELIRLPTDTSAPPRLRFRCMSKALSLFTPAVLAFCAVASVSAQDSAPSKQRFQISSTAPQSIVQKGDRLQIQTVAPLMDNPPEVTVVDFGPRGWVLVTYDKKFLKLATEAAPEQQVAEKYEVWINFDHVIAVKRIPADRK